MSRILTFVGVLTVAGLSGCGNASPEDAKLNIEGVDAVIDSSESRRARDVEIYSQSARDAGHDETTAKEVGEFAAIACQGESAC